MSTDHLAPPDLRLLGARRRIFGEPGFDLVSLDVTEAPSGALVYVASVRAYFQFIRGSTLTADGITVVTAAKNQGRWLRQMPPPNTPSSWLTQTGWWISRQHGSDENDGASALSPLRTHAEFTRRMGWNPRLTQTYTVHIIDMFDVGQVPVAEGLTWEATFVGPTAAVLYQGVLQVGANQGTVGAFVAMSPVPGPNGAEGYFTDSLGFLFNTSVGRLVGFDIAGPTPSYVFISNSNTGNTHARITNPTYRTGLRAFSAVTPTPGMTWQEYIIPNVNGVNLYAHREDIGIGVPAEECATFILEFLNIQNGNTGLGEIKLAWDGGDPTWQSSSTPSPYLIHCTLCRVVDSQIFAVSCMSGAQGFPGATAFEDSSVFLLSHNGGSVSFTNCDIMALDFGVGNSYFDGSVGVQFLTGTRITNPTDAVSFGVYCTGADAAVVVDTGVTMHFESVWGTAAAGQVAMRVDGWAWYSAGALLEIAKGGGAATDLLIGGVGVNYGQLPWANVVTNGVGGNTAMLIQQP